MATLAVIGVISVIVLQNLNSLQTDRYLSIGRSDGNFSSTAKGRIDGVIEAIKVGLRRPIVGHGLGTSLEANYNRFGNNTITHNLYVEVLQELGVLGLAIFLFFLKSIAENMTKARAKLAKQQSPSPYLVNLMHGLQCWFVMELVFSLASYGLSLHKWYLLAGLTVVAGSLTNQLKNAEDPALVKSAMARNKLLQPTR